MLEKVWLNFVRVIINFLVVIIYFECCEVCVDLVIIECVLWWIVMGIWKGFINIFF